MWSWVETRVGLGLSVQRLHVRASWLRAKTWMWGWLVALNRPVWMWLWIVVCLYMSALWWTAEMPGGVGGGYVPPRLPTVSWDQLHSACSPAKDKRLQIMEIANNISWPACSTLTAHTLRVTDVYSCLNIHKVQKVFCHIWCDSHWLSRYNARFCRETLGPYTHVDTTWCTQPIQTPQWMNYTLMATALSNGIKPPTNPLHQAGQCALTHHKNCSGTAWGTQ